jgi:hypothetical protein
MARGGQADRQRDHAHRSSYTEHGQLTAVIDGSTPGRIQHCPAPPAVIGGSTPGRIQHCPALPAVIGGAAMSVARPAGEGPDRGRPGK